MKTHVKQEWSENNQEINQQYTAVYHFYMNFLHIHLLQKQILNNSSELNVAHFTESTNPSIA